MSTTWLVSSWTGEVAESVRGNRARLRIENPIALIVCFVLYLVRKAVSMTTNYHDDNVFPRLICDRFRMRSHGHGIDPFRENYQQLYESSMASLESTAYARQWNDQLTAELNGYREKLGNLETYEEDAKSSRLNLLVRNKHLVRFAKAPTVVGLRSR